MRASTIALTVALLLLATVPAAAIRAPSTTTSTTDSSTSPRPFGPTAAFTYNPCVMCLVIGDLVFFNASWSASPFGTITLYTWNFGDGSPPLNTTNPSINHDYPGQPAQWKATLTVTDNHGQTDTLTQLVMFDIHPFFSLHPTRPLVGQPVIFNATDSISYNTNNPIKTYLWTFGDETNATGVIVKHAYVTPGIYRVALTLVTSNGNPQISETVRVGHRIFQGTFNNVNVTITGSLNFNSTSKILTGTLDVTAVNTTSGTTTFSKTLDFTLTYSQTMSTPRFVLVVPAGTYSIGVGCSFNLDTYGTSCILSKNPDVANQGTVNITDVATIAMEFESTQYGPNWNGNADLNDDGMVSISDLAIVALEYGATLIE